VPLNLHQSTRRRPVTRDTRSSAYTYLCPPGAPQFPDSGRARLSYRRAAECFERSTADMPGGPWELHQLRHSALIHAAEEGANTATLLACAGHASVASLARYTRVSSESLANWQQQRDPARLCR